jgi:hypothetical protein|eukprot:COSAG01_NODE_5928_length_3947_cov_3.364865_4_plen_270_part_00
MSRLFLSRNIENGNGTPGVISAVAVASNILLLWCGLSANAHNSWFASFGLVQLPSATFDTVKYEWQLEARRAIPCPAGGCDWAMCNPPGSWTSLTAIEQLEWQQPSFCFSYAEVQTMLYVQLSLSAYMTIWAARTRNSFMSRMPSPQLFIAIVMAMIGSTILGATWPFPKLEPLEWTLLAFIWAYCFIWFLAQDLLKIVVYLAIEHWKPSAVEAVDNRATKMEDLASRPLDDRATFDEDRRSLWKANAVADAAQVRAPALSCRSVLACV